MGPCLVGHSPKRKQHLLMTGIVSFEDNVPRILNSKKGWLALLTSGNFISYYSFVNMISWRQGLKEKWYCRCFDRCHFRYLKWRVSWTLWPAILWMGFPLHKPYPYSLYRIYIGEDLHFGYLKCLVPLLPEKTRVSGISKKFLPRLVSETISSPHNSPPEKKKKHQH